MVGMKRILLVGCLVCLFVGSVGAQEGEIRVVTVTGEAAIVGTGDKAVKEAREAALAQALRNAIEQGGLIDVYSKSDVQDAELIYDRVIARSSGIVTDYRILDEQKKRGVYYIEIRAKVSTKALTDTWGEAQMLLEQVGRPRMMVTIGENVDGETALNQAVQTTIENNLLELGFSLVNKEQVEAIKDLDLQEATVNQDLAALQAIGRRAGAEVIITGMAVARFGGEETVYGTTLYAYDANVDLKAIRTDTGQLLASEKAHAIKKYPTENAYWKALGEAGEKISTQLIKRMFRQWTDDIQSGSEVVLMVKGIDFLTLEDLEAALKDVEGVEEVQTRNFRNEVAEINVKYKSSGQSPARDLARKLARMKEVNLSVQGITGNRVDVIVKQTSSEDEEF